MNIFENLVTTILFDLICNSKKMQHLIININFYEL